jgi:hypothetical protein
MADDDLDDVRACIDMLPPPAENDARMALMKGATWPEGSAIRIRFLDGDPGVQERVKSVATTWLDGLDLQFFWVTDEPSDIRITFTQKGSWSQIGTFCRSVAAPQPTMNYGWLQPASTDDELRRVVLHEFGHALGCIHEHQNPEGGIQWNEPAVYAYYEGPPNNWSPDEVKHNVLEAYSRDLLTFTPVDGTSIMMYPIDSKLTTNGFSAGWNTELSATDRSFIKSIYG